jgi:hypothetical protein
VAIGAALEERIREQNAEKAHVAGQKGGAMAGRGRPKASRDRGSAICATPISLPAPEAIPTNGAATPPKQDYAARTEAQVGKAVGLGGTTYRKAKAVVEAAEASPARYGDLVEKMDETGNVDKAYQVMQQRADTDAQGGPTPRQRAAEDPARRWTKTLHDLWKLMNSVKVFAGGDIRLLVATWTPAQRAGYAAQLRAIGTTLAPWVTALEEGLPDDGGR